MKTVDCFSVSPSYTWIIHKHNSNLNTGRSIFIKEQSLEELSIGWELGHCLYDECKCNIYWRWVGFLIGEEGTFLCYLEQVCAIVIKTKRHHMPKARILRAHLLRHLPCAPHQPPSRRPQRQRVTQGVTSFQIISRYQRCRTFQNFRVLAVLCTAICSEPIGAPNLQGPLQ